MKKTLRFLFSVLLLLSYVTHTHAETPYNADIVVALDGSGDFTKLQAAINAVPNNSDRRTVIYLKRGKYDTEKLIVPSTKKNVTIIGESRDQTIISYHIYDCTSASSDNKCPADAWELWKDNADLIRTSATLTVSADGFIAENLTIENTAGPVGQALAITITGDKGIYRNCNFLGYQDTIYLWTAGKRSYFENCLVAGRTDYIYGAGIAFFESCEIRSWGGGWITAPSTPQEQAYGYVFNNCAVTYATGSPRNGDDGAKFALGRPWHGYPKVAWLYCEMSDMINPLGWPTIWNMEYAATSTDLHLYEYKNTGAGADMSGRANWAGLRAMTDDEALNYTVQKVMAGSDNWDPTATPPAVKSYTWTGAENASWLNANNWSPVGVPANGETAAIDGDFTVVADGETFAADLTLSGASKLDVKASSTASYLALSGGEIQASSAAGLAGKLQTKAATTFNIAESLNLSAILIGVHDITKVGNGSLTLSADNSSYSGKFEITGGTMVLNAAGSSGLSGIDVKTGGKLVIDADNSVNVKSVLKVETGGKIQINKPVTLNELYINDVMQEPGSYNATTHSSVFEGTESILVGRPTMFEWNPTDGKRWGNASNYKPALLPLSGDTVSVEVEMEADGVAFAGTILLKKANIRLVGNATGTGDIIMSSGTKFTYATSGAGFSIDSKIKLEGDIIMQMSGNGVSNAITMLGNIEGNSKVTAYNYTNTDYALATVILSGNNNGFTGTWDATMASRKSTAVAAFEGKSENAFGSGKIVIATGNKVYFSHAKSASETTELDLADGAKAVMTTSATVGKLTLAGTEYTTGTFSATSHASYFEGAGVLTVSAPTGIEPDYANKGNLYFDGRDVIATGNINKLTILDVQGRILKTYANQGQKVTLALAQGIYVVKATVDGEETSIKIAVTNR